MFRGVLPPHREKQRMQRDIRAIRQRFPGTEERMSKSDGMVYRGISGDSEERRRLTLVSAEGRIDEVKERSLLESATSPQEAERSATLIRMGSKSPVNTLMDACTDVIEWENKNAMEGLVPDIHDIVLTGSSEERLRAIGLLMGMTEKGIKKAHNALKELGIMERNIKRGIREFIGYLALPALGAAAGVYFVDFKLAIVAVGVALLAKIIGEKKKESEQEF
jgi:hypothetical protein